MWGMEYRARTGFPLANYQEKWDALRPLKKGATNEKVHSAMIRFSDFVTLSTPQAEYRIKNLAFDYLNSFPGPDEAAKNRRVHGTCRRLLEDRALSNNDLEDLAGALRYRLETIVDQATEYKNRHVDTFAYKARISGNYDFYSKYGVIHEMVYSQKLFDGPADHEGMPYIKGGDYLTIVFLESGWTLEQIQDGVEGLARLRGNYIYFYGFGVKSSKSKLILPTFSL